MGKNSEYYKDKLVRERITLERQLSNLPDCCSELMKFKEQKTQLSTLISYCYDLATFFRFYLALPQTKEEGVKEITYRTLENIPTDTFYQYMKYLEYNDKGEFHCNSKKGINHKMISIRNLYRFAMSRHYIAYNPMDLVQLPKLVRDREIVRLTKSEVNALLKAARSQNCFKRGRMKTYRKKSKDRDYAILLLLLNTGIRVSELCGLDIDDIDLKNRSITIIRKGGFADFVYFNENIVPALKTYIKGERKEFLEQSKSKAESKALFISLRGNRISIDAVERMVKAYTTRIPSLKNKHITPHKLRSTYGTELYKQTSDIRLVAEVLGHSNINTTIRYYAAMDESQKKRASRKVDFSLKSLKEELKSKEEVNLEMIKENSKKEKIKVVEEKTKGKIIDFAGIRK